MEDNLLEKSFLSLYDKFHSLNSHCQIKYKTDTVLVGKLKTISLIFEDLNEHYFWEEINRRDEENGESNAH
jgi:hypothetical protein